MSRKIGKRVGLTAFLFSATLYSATTFAGALTQYELTLPKELDCAAVEFHPTPLSAVIEAGAVQVYDRDWQLVHNPHPVYRWQGSVFTGSYSLPPTRSFYEEGFAEKYGHYRTNHHHLVVDMLRSFARIGFDTEESALLFRVEPRGAPTPIPFSLISPGSSIGMDGVVGLSHTNMTMVFYYEETTRDLSGIANDRMYLNIPETTIRRHPVYAALTVEDKIVKRAVAFVRIAPEIGETRRRMVRALNVLFGNLHSAHGFNDFSGAPAWTGLTGWSREELCHLARTYST